ncbi:DUF4435 domain-containing protein [Ramlibacter tataouinensis]|uniref:DUF4435 domain-containing protein n=1 Tax=Ramlibacter tataouinensis TaxID=94132 RepID=UPI0009DB1F73|nr:DUF4435 domain-containing protein [Ramlibacter tataouinensis]
MANEVSNVDGPGDLLQEMRDSRERPTVLKIKLATLRAQLPDVLVLAFEGIDDKVIYYHWLKQVAPFLTYEFIVCKGKGKLLEFRELLKRDRAELYKSVYFFVDRDFDGLRGHPDGPDVYITDAYSVENYLVCKEVLAGVLAVEIDCHGQPACRQAVLEKFDEVYDAFLVVTREVNKRIFLARRIGISRKEPWPEKLNSLAKVQLVTVESSGVAPEALVVLDREPTGDEITLLQSEFDALDPRQRYRGKFAYMFLKRWLQLLAADRNSEASVFFAGLDKEGEVAQGHVPLDSLAAKSSAPPSLKHFIDTITGGLKVPPLGVQGGQAA